MVERMIMGSSGGNSNVQNGTFTLTSSSNSFDCGITDPDIVLVFMDRFTNDWIVTYANNDALGSDYDCSAYAVESSEASPSTQSVKLSVSGSTVSMTYISLWNNITFKWVAIKL